VEDRRRAENFAGNDTPPFFALYGTQSVAVAHAGRAEPAGRGREKLAFEYGELDPAERLRTTFQAEQQHDYDDRAITAAVVPDKRAARPPNKPAARRGWRSRSRLGLGRRGAQPSASSSSELPPTAVSEKPSMTDEEPEDGDPAGD
jgi:hypothetical protein